MGRLAHVAPPRALSNHPPLRCLSARVGAAPFCAFLVSSPFVGPVEVPPRSRKGASPLSRSLVAKIGWKRFFCENGRWRLPKKNDASKRTLACLQHGAVAAGGKWRTMLGISIVPPFIILSSLCLLPESPRWLLGKGRERDAFSVLCTVCST